MRSPGGWGRRPAKPAKEVITDFGAEKAATAVKELAEASRGKDGDEAALENASPLASGVSHFSTAPATAKITAKPADEVITDSGVIADLNPSQPDEVGAVSSAPVASPQRSPSASACESYREAIE